MSDELKPCPVCRGQASYSERQYQNGTIGEREGALYEQPFYVTERSISCTACGIIKYGAFKADIVEAWNALPRPEKA